jgi:hypothetical protein
MQEIWLVRINDGFCNIHLYMWKQIFTVLEIIRIAELLKVDSWDGD